MQRFARNLFALLLLSALAFGQSNVQNPGGTGGGLPAGTIAPGILQTGLIAQYDFNQGSGTVLTDKSTNGNNGALCASTAAPTWVANTGGLLFAAASSQCVTLPAAVNAAKTIQIFMSYQPQNNLAVTPFHAFPIVGNGTAANTAGLDLVEGCNTNAGFIPAASAPCTLTPHINTYGGGSFAQLSLTPFTGVGMISWVQDATLDLLYINNIGPLPCNALSCTGHTGGTQTAGVYQLGGRAAGFANSNTSFWNGTMYYALFYNVELTQSQIEQNYQAVSQAMQARGVPLLCSAGTGFCASNTSPTMPAQSVGLTAGLGLNFGTAAAQNVIVSTGDSEDVINGGYFLFMAPAAATGSWLPYAISHSGAGTPYNPGQEPIDSCQLVSANGINVDHIWWGQNEAGAAGFIQRLSSHSKLLQACGFQTIIGTELSCSCAGQATNNALTYTNWKSFGNALADIASSPSLGATNASGNATYFPDGLHVSASGQNIVGNIWQKALNREILGNKGWNTASTYTTTAPAATAITAASETTNTVLFTFAATPASFILGGDVYITGVTPAGYNTTSQDTVCHIISRTGTQIGCNYAATGLGAGTVFGVASTPTQLDTDNYVILAGSATTPAFTLESCQGLTDAKVYVKNSNTTSPWTIESAAQFSGAFATETIDGATTLAMPAASSGNNPVIVLQAALISQAAGGCVWKRLQ